MTGVSDRLRAVALALLMVTSLFAVANVGAAAPGDPSTYAVKQGGTCYEVTPLGDGTQNVSDFYDYRAGQGTLYGSYGTTHIQENQVSQLFLYNGSDGVSLVMLHDKLQEGPNASTTTFHLSGLPESREWVVEDDDYPNRDDEFIHNGTESTIHWKWAKHRTDGAAVRGLEGDNYTAIEIQPGFNEDAEHWNVWPYSGDEQNKTAAWKLIRHPDNASTPGDKAVLDMNQNVTVEQGTCGTSDSAPTAALSAQPTTVEEGDQVSFDASGSTDDGSIVEYRWDFDGDGTIDDTTSSATTTHTYGTNGTYDAMVTVVDDAGQTDDASVTITVTDPDDQAPNADLEVSPSEAEAGDQVTLDASGSTDNGQIVEYRWDFDGDGSYDSSTQANTTTHTYSQTVQFNATVLVIDAGGNSDTANATVNVSDTTPPVAKADVPSTVVNGSTFQVDGSASTDNGQIVSYEWDFGDGNTATGATASHAYQDNSTYTVTLTVTDDAGNDNSTSAQIQVTDEDTQDPTAVIDAPGSATVGEDVSFDGSGSSDDGDIVSYEWEFDDGSNASGAMVSHAYQQTGTYTVTLTVTDGAGNTDTATHEITVEEQPDQPPEADFTWTVHEGNDRKILFDASPSSDDNGIVAYDWDLHNDGNYHQSGVSATEIYEFYGTVDVTLWVEDAAGNVDTKTRTVTIEDRTDPSVGISAPAKVNVGQQFTAEAVDIWDNGEVTHLCWFVDGKEVGGDYQEQLTLAFDQPGEHTLKLRIADGNDNAYTAMHTVKVVANSGGGGGGGGGGNTGGDTGDDTNTNVDDSGDRIHVDVDNAKSDQPFTVDLPTGTEAGDGLAAFDSITVTLSRSGDYDMTIDALAEAPENVTAPTVESEGFEPLGYLVVERPDLSDDDVADAEFTFTIQQSRLDALGADASDVQIYRHDDGSWAAVETTVVEETDDVVRFRASDADLSTYAVAIDRPVIELADLSVGATELAPGETVEITATIENVGQASDVVSVELGVDGETVDTRDITVGANGQRSVTFERTFEEPGTHTVSVNGQEVEVVVQSEETSTPTATPTDAPATTPGDGQPGFGVILAVLAMLGAALLARRLR